MNDDKLFKAASDAGFEIFEARISTDGELTADVFNDKLETLTVADSALLRVRGAANGKVGSFSSDRTDDGVTETAISAVKQSAAYGQPVDTDLFISGGQTYEKVNGFFEELDAASAETIIELAKSLGKKTLEKDNRIESVRVQAQYVKNTLSLKNSKGLDVKSAKNYIMIYASTKAKSNGEVVSGMFYEFVQNLAAFDADGFTSELVKRTAGQFGGKSVKSGKYKAVYAPEVIAQLLEPVKSGFSAFNVEQHMSLLEGKTGERIFSPLVDIDETPIGSGPFCRAFDAEGVPCRNKKLVDKGVITGYVYDLATAKRAGVASTGNGALEGGNIRPSVGFVTVNGGGKTLEKLFEFIGDGLYITEVQGIGTGLNAQSGAYSLQANGYEIKDGKKGAPVSLITVAGNVMTDLNNVIAVGNDVTLTYAGVKTPSVAIDEISVSGV